MKIQSLALAVALAPFAVAPALAYQSIDEEVIVTASLLPIDPSRATSALTVIDSQTIHNRAPVAVSDLLRNVPGLAVSRNGVLGSATQVRARGAEGNHLLVMIDGVEANDPSQGDEFNWGTLTAANIERIEVIRGPQSALYGSDAVAGVVNIITRSAAEPFSAALFSEAGSFDTRHNGASIGGRGEAFDVRLDINDVDAGGANISSQGGERDGYRNTTYSVKGSWRPADNLAINLTSRHQNGFNQFDAVDFVTTGLPVDADLRSEFRNRTTRLQGEYSLLDGAWQHRLAYSRSDNDNENFDTGAQTGSTASRKEQFQYLTSLLWDGDAQSLSLALEREDEDFSQRGPVSPWGDDPNQDLGRDTTSAGAEYRGTFMEVLTLAAGVRHDDNSEFDDATTWKLEGAYRLADSTRVRAALGTSVKNPTFTERFGYYASSPFYPYVGNPNLEPEESRSWEVGIDQGFLDGAAELSLTWFDAELRNEIDGYHFDPDLQATTGINLAGKSHRKGLEAGLSARLADNVRVTAAYTYTDSTQQDAATGQRQRELRRARHIASTSLDWQALAALNLHLNVQYNGSQDDRFFPPWPLPQQLVELDSYTLVNLTATYSFNDALELYVKGENLLDERYEEVYGFATPGAGGYLGVRYNFVR